MIVLPRDLRAILQIAHVGAWNVATPEVLQLQRAALWAGKSEDLQPAKGHDPTAVLALRDWLEAVTVRDAVGRKIPTWIAETSGRSLCGDQPSILYARTLAKRTFASLHQARLLVTGPGEHPLPEAKQHFPSHHRSAPVCFRAPHGAWEVQFFASDPHCDAAVAPSEWLREEFAPEPTVQQICIVATHAAAHAPAATAQSKVLPLCSMGHSLAIKSTTATTIEDEQRTELLRVYASPTRAKLVVIERLVFERKARMGAFLLLESQSSEEAHAW